MDAYDEMQDIQEKESDELLQENEELKTKNYDDCEMTRKAEDKMEEKNIAVVSPIVLPAVTAVEAKEAWGKYQELKQAIVEKLDVQKIQGKDFLKKSYWRKVQRFFNLKLELVKEERIIKADVNDKESIAYSAVYRAIAPNGSHCDGDGFCETWEKGRFNVEHNVRATAHTRAKNRAISDLVGGGEVSAEEVAGDYENGNGHEEVTPKVATTKVVYMISEPQAKRLYAIARGSGYSGEIVNEYLKSNYQIEDAYSVTKNIYETVVEHFKTKK